VNFTEKAGIVQSIQFYRLQSIVAVFIVWGSKTCFVFWSWYHSVYQATCSKHVCKPI